MSVDPRKIADRIARKLGAADLVDELIALPGNELASLLLEVMRRRSRRRSPRELLEQARRDRCVHPTTDDPRAVLALEAYAIDAAAADGFAPVTLSPVAPLRLNAVLGDIDQNSTLAALRNLEVLADPTTVLAAQTALERHGDAVVKKCCVGRMLRMQPFDDPAFSRHFALFALTTGGRARPGHQLELDALAGHAAVHLTLLERSAAEGYRVRDVGIEVSDTDGDAPGRIAAVESRVFPALQARFPHARFTIDRARTHAMQYYRGLCLHVVARDVDRNMLPIGDGGSTDWLARLTSNGKERFFVSGLGLEVLLRRFR